MVRCWRAVIFGVVCVASCPGGCRPSGEEFYRKFTDDDPSVRLWAIRQAGDSKDERSVPYLVDRLSDVEPDVRMFAILALEKITGTRRGYEYYAPAAEREQAVERWRQWLQSRQGPAATREVEGKP